MRLEWRGDLHRKKSSRYGEFVDELRLRPGMWAKMPDEIKGPAKPYGVVSNINRGRLRAFPPEDFEAMTYEGAVWVRKKP